MKKLFVFLLVLLLVGCASKQSRREGFIAGHPGLSQEEASAIRGGQIFTGMSMSMVEASWGPSCSWCPGASKTVYDNVRMDTWVYNSMGPNYPSLNTYVYFESGGVKGWSKAGN